MSHRVAVLLADRCQPRKCNQECITFCPPVRSGVTETIYMGEHGKPIISEELCIGCGICVNKCPFDAIRIIGLPEELEDETVQRYGLNGFRLFRLPEKILARRPAAAGRIRTRIRGNAEIHIPLDRGGLASRQFRTLPLLA